MNLTADINPKLCLWANQGDTSATQENQCINPYCDLKVCGRNPLSFFELLYPYEMKTLLTNKDFTSGTEFPGQQDMQARL